MYIKCKFPVSFIFPPGDVLENIKDICNLLGTLASKKESHDRNRSLKALE